MTSECSFFFGFSGRILNFSPVVLLCVPPMGRSFSHLVPGNNILVTKRQNEDTQNLTLY